MYLEFILEQFRVKHCFDFFLWSWKFIWKTLEKVNCALPKLYGCTSKGNVLLVTNIIDLTNVQNTCIWCDLHVCRDIDLIYDTFMEECLFWENNDLIMPQQTILSKTYNIFRKNATIYHCAFTRCHIKLAMHIKIF